MSTTRALTHPWEAMTLGELDQEIARRAFGADIEDRDTGQGLVAYWRTKRHKDQWSIMPSFHKDVNSLLEALYSFSSDKPDISDWDFYVFRKADDSVRVSIVVDDNLGGVGEASTPAIAFAYALLDLIDRYYKLKQAQLPLFSEAKR